MSILPSFSTKYQYSESFFADVRAKTEPDFLSLSPLISIYEPCVVYNIQRGVQNTLFRKKPYNGYFKCKIALVIKN